jgi:DNA polymerase III epsilon subunit
VSFFIPQTVTLNSPPLTPSAWNLKESSPLRQVVISIETTGPELSSGDKVIEIGAVELIDEKPTGKSYHQYINPRQPVEKAFIGLHAITDEFLADKPIFSEIADEFLEFIGTDEIVTYNAKYILPFLHSEISYANNFEHDEKLNNDVVDVLLIGEERHPNQNNNLHNLCERYYVDTSSSDFHGALARAEKIAFLLVALIDDSTKKITSDLSRYETGENLIIVESFAEFDKAIEGISKTALCRGVSNHEYALLPSLFRHIDTESTDTREHNLMWVFKTHAKAHLAKTPENEIEWMVIAQHHGLPTRLLDWSLSPLVACFFAVQSLSKEDAAIYIYDIGKFKKEEDIKSSDLRDIVAFFPSHATKRVTAQSGMFTIHPTNEMKLESDSIQKILIPAQKKKYFLEKLVKFGIHQGTIFPDLDGLSNYIRHLNGYKQ